MLRNGEKISSSAEKVLGVKLSPLQKRAVEEAYLVGDGQIGRDGTPARIGNYTQAQLRRKTEILKESGFSPSQRRNLNAGIKLEQALQAIRNSPQEPLLREQGFKASYYAGVDQAREFNRVYEYVQEVQADPESTHIPYFADQVEKTISDFERDLRTQTVTIGDSIRLGTHVVVIRDPQLQEKRLRILEDFKKEARRRVENQDVTYNWWVKFNTKLSLLASLDTWQHIIASRYTHPVERVKMGVEIEYNKKLAGRLAEKLNSTKSDSEEIRQMRRKLKSLNPEDLFFGERYTSQELESLLFEWGVQDSDLAREIQDESFPSSIEELREKQVKSIEFDIKDIQIEIIKEEDWYNIDVLPIKEGIEEIISNGIPSPFVPQEIRILSINIISREFPKTMMFFTTDELGIMAFNELGDNSHFIGLFGGSEKRVDDKRMDSFQYLTHDVGHAESSISWRKRNIELAKEVFDRVNNIPNKSGREKAALALFIYRHEVGDRKNDLSQSAIEHMMFDERLQWLKPGDLQGLLPNGVDVKDEAEVESFLRASAHRFREILSGPQQ